MPFKLNAESKIILKKQDNSCYELDTDIICGSLHDFDKTMQMIKQDIPVDIFEILGLRNLSAFVGEVFAKQIEKNSDGLLHSNPHQDGYPDLLLMDSDGQKLLEQIKLRDQLRDKAPFSPFANGGIEVKATCGSVPTQKALAKKGLQKPSIGEKRISICTGYDWKAHHRETNNLLGIFWDFSEIEKLPFIAATFFCNNLCEEDWGTIVQPKEGGGRTTSVSIMTKSGIFKMYENWITVDQNVEYAKMFNKRNKSSLMP